MTSVTWGLIVVQTQVLSVTKGMVDSSDNADRVKTATRRQKRQGVTELKTKTEILVSALTLGQ